MKKDLLHRRFDEGPRAVTGSQAAAQKIVAIAFSPSHPFRKSAGNCYNIVKGNITSRETMIQTIQMGLTTAAAAVRTQYPNRDINMKIVDLQTDQDRVAVHLRMQYGDEITENVLEL